MIVDASALAANGTPDSDVTVVGAGAVGIIAALELAGRGLRVLLLDAGPELVEAKSQAFFRSAKSTGKKHRGLHEGRFRALGGTTNFWGGQLVRFDSVVFRERPWVDRLSRWPIGLNDLETYYRRCEDILKIPEKLRSDDAVFALAGVPPVHSDPQLVYFLTRWLTEKNFRVRFYQELRRAANLTVVTNAPVVRIHADASGQTAIAVRIQTPLGKAADIGCKTLILANGTIEIARLLKHSLADGRKPVWAENDWLGAGFMDHLEGTLGEVKVADPKLFRRMFDNLFVKGMKFQPRLRVSEQTQIERKLLNFAVHLRFEGANREHFDNAKIFFVGLLKGRFSGPLLQLPRHIYSAVVVGAPMVWHYLASKRIFTPSQSTIKLRIMLEQQQTRASRITLASETDSLGMNVVELRWQVAGEKEMETIRAASRMVKEYFESRAIGTVKIAGNVEDGTTDWLDQAEDTFHHMGTTRMANTPSEGVVDKNCKVFGTQNVFIAGASVFPSAGFANPTFTAMALVLRLCDHLAEERVHAAA